MKWLLLAILTLLVTPSLVSAHGQPLPPGYEITFTPQVVFQGDPVGVEAVVLKDGQPLTNLDVTLEVEFPDSTTPIIDLQERLPGHYAGKYTFDAAGSINASVVFDFEGREIVKEFMISVVGNGMGLETYAYWAIGLSFILAVAYGIKSRRGKRAFAILLVLLGLVGLGYSLFVSEASGAAGRGVFVCPTPETCYWSSHIHATVTVSICGEEYRFPTEVGPLDGPHTHEEKNLIHYHERLPVNPQTKEILNTTQLQLGTFFDNMELAFGSDRVMDKQNGDLCNGQPSTVKLFVNGQPNGDFRNYVWSDGDKIDIYFDEKTPADVAPQEPKKHYAIAAQLSLPIIVGFALIDSINPCVIGVLLLLISVLIKTKRRRSILVNGTVYTLGVYVTYLIGGLTLLSIFNAVREVQTVSQIFYVGIGSFVLFAAFLEIKDYFWYGRWFGLQIPHRFIKYVESGAKGSKVSLLSAFVFGGLVTLIELPCTGAPYLAILTLMSQSGMGYYQALSLLLLYNLVFIIPLFAIIYLAYKGIGYKRMEFWRREQKGKMRLAVGIMLLGIAVWIITAVLDWLLLPLAAAIFAAIGLMAIAKRVSERPRPYARPGMGKGSPAEAPRPKRKRKGRR